MTILARRFGTSLALAVGLFVVGSAFDRGANAQAPAIAEIGGSVTVVMDQARVMRLPPRVSTLVIGNPMIADATVQPGGLMVLTGKGVGTTNIIALDARGQQLMTATVRVQGQTDNIVRVYRGIDRESYSCNPVCERAMSIGDAAAHFDAAIGQAGKRASALAAPAAPR